jgi:hypothetical protein
MLQRNKNQKQVFFVKFIQNKKDEHVKRLVKQHFDDLMQWLCFKVESLIEK